MKALRNVLRFIEALVDIISKLIKKLFLMVIVAFLGALALAVLAVVIITKIAN